MVVLVLSILMKNHVQFSAKVNEAKAKSQGINTNQIFVAVLKSTPLLLPVIEINDDVVEAN